MVQLARFERQVAATGAKKEWVALVMKTLKSHPKLNLESLTEEFAVGLGHALNFLSDNAKGKEAEAFRAFNLALGYINIDFDGTACDKISRQITRILGSSPKGIPSAEGSDLLAFLLKGMTSPGSALLTLENVNRALELEIPRGIIKLFMTAHQSSGAYGLEFFLANIHKLRSAGLMEYMGKYEAGMKLAKSVGADALDPEIFLNFAYAISTVGADIATKLAKDLGIVYFRRYTPATLNAVYSNLDPKNTQGKPLLFINYAKYDFNGTFYQNGKHIESLTRHYRLIIVESEKEQDIYSSLEKYGKAFGPAAGLLTFGHGTPGNITLSSGKDEKYSIDHSDADEWRALISRHFVPEAFFGLISCSTGKANDSVFSIFSPNGGKTTAFAPTEDSRLIGFDLTADGAFIRPLYSVPSRQMVGGIQITMFNPTPD